MVLHFDFKWLTGLVLALAACQFLGGDTLIWGTAFWVILGDSKKESLYDMVVCAALLFNLWYMLASWGNTRQYDYYNFFMHADYFLKNDFFLKNPISYIYTIYFQPPLWGAIAGIFLKAGESLGESIENAYDYVRFVNFWCVGGCFILFWRLMALFGFNFLLRLGLLTLFCVFPINTILSSLVNNDAAVYFLMLASVYYSLNWFESERWCDVLALCVIFIMAGLIKFSGLMTAPAVGGLWLIKIYHNRGSKRLWLQGVCLAAALILGFSWGLFLLYFHFPLVPPPLNLEYQSMAGYSIAERLFSMQNVFEPFVDVRSGQVEPNVWLALVKTSLFGEWLWNGEVWAQIMYGLTLIGAVFSLWCFFFLFKLKCGMNWSFNVFAVITAAVVLGAWFHFWYAYPYFCSSEFRYVVILLPLSLLWCGNYLQYKKLPKAVSAALAVCLALFVAAKVMLYLNTI